MQACLKHAAAHLLWVITLRLLARRPSMQTFCSATTAHHRAIPQGTGAWRLAPPRTTLSTPVGAFARRVRAASLHASLATSFLAMQTGGLHASSAALQRLLLGFSLLASHLPPARQPPSGIYLLRNNAATREWAHAYRAFYDKCPNGHDQSCAYEMMRTQVGVQAGRVPWRNAGRRRTHGQRPWNLRSWLQHDQTMLRLAAPVLPRPPARAAHPTQPTPPLHPRTLTHTHTGNPNHTHPTIAPQTPHSPSQGKLGEPHPSTPPGEQPRVFSAWHNKVWMGILPSRWERGGASQGGLGRRNAAEPPLQPRAAAAAPLADPSPRGPGCPAPVCSIAMSAHTASVQRLARVRRLCVPAWR